MANGNAIKAGLILQKAYYIQNSTTRKKQLCSKGVVKVTYLNVECMYIAIDDQGIDIPRINNTSSMVAELDRSDRYYLEGFYPA